MVYNLQCFQIKDLVYKNYFSMLGFEIKFFSVLVLRKSVGTKRGTQKPLIQSNPVITTSVYAHSSIVYGDGGNKWFTA